MTISIPMRTQGSNAREAWQVRHRRVGKERRTVAMALLGQRKPAIPCTVLLTRVARSNGLDDDNLTAALKGVRDQVAEWLGVDDRDRMTVRYRYAQRRGQQPMVLIEFGPPVAGAQFALTIGASVDDDPFGEVRR